jgi:arylsulfatase A-like enzyme
MVTPGTGGAAEPVEQAPMGPSIILVSIDALRADFLGCYGFQGSVSPNLDRLAAESLLFERCSSQAPSTLPSVASLFTSLHPIAHGVVARPPPGRGNAADELAARTNAIPAGAITLAEVLRDAGYMTAAFVSNPWLAPIFDFDRGFGVYDQSTTGLEMSGDRVVRAATEWLRGRRPTPSPVFLYIHLMDVHGPYSSPAEDVAAVRDAPGLGADRELTERELSRISEYLLRPSWTGSAEGRRLRGWRSRYAAGVHSVDRHLASFLEELRSLRILDRSAIIITSDHGEELCEHGGWNHGRTLYEHQLHVPLIIRYPGGKLRGVRVSETVRVTDVMRTLLGLAGCEIPAGVRGRDVTPGSRGADPPEAERIITAAGIGARPSVHGVSNGKHKLIIDLATGDAELYDLETDPGEQVDLISRRPEVAHQLKTRLLAEIRRVQAGSPNARAVVDIDPARLRWLRELGYLE